MPAVWPVGAHLPIFHLHFWLHLILMVKLVSFQLQPLFLAMSINDNQQSIKAIIINNNALIGIGNQ